MAPAVYKNYSNSLITSKVSARTRIYRRTANWYLRPRNSPVTLKCGGMNIKVSHRLTPHIEYEIGNHYEPTSWSNLPHRRTLMRLERNSEKSRKLVLSPITMLPLGN